MSPSEPLFQELAPKTQFCQIGLLIIYSFCSIHVNKLFLNEKISTKTWQNPHELFVTLSFSPTVLRYLLHLKNCNTFWHTFYQDFPTITENFKISSTDSENSENFNISRNIWRNQNNKNYRVQVNIYHLWNVKKNQLTHYLKIACTKIPRNKKTHTNTQTDKRGLTSVGKRKTLIYNGYFIAESIIWGSNEYGKYLLFLHVEK